MDENTDTARDAVRRAAELLDSVDLDALIVERRDRYPIIADRAETEAIELQVLFAARLFRNQSRRYRKIVEAKAAEEGSES